jgi:hypothetical protein
MSSRNVCRIAERVQVALHTLDVNNNVCNNNVYTTSTLHTCTRSRNRAVCSEQNRHLCRTCVDEYRNQLDVCTAACGKAAQQRHTTRFVGATENGGAM